MTEAKTEIVVVAHGQHGTIKYVYLSAVLAVASMKQLTNEGFVIASVYERERKHFSAERYPELYK